MCNKLSRFHFNSWIVSKDIEKQMTARKDFLNLLSRESHFCSHCLSSNRKRALFSHMQLNFGHKINECIENHDGCNRLSILIVGNLGKGSYLQKIITNRFEVTTTFFDPSLPFGIRSSKGVNADIQNLCFPSQTFNYVIHSDVLEHVSDPSLALESCLNVLKPGGSVIFTIPIDYSLSKSKSTLARGKRIWHGRGKWIYSILPRRDGYLERHVFGNDFVEYLTLSSTGTISTFWYRESGAEVPVFQLDKNIDDRVGVCI